jgi:hypothetical protein
MTLLGAVLLAAAVALHPVTVDPRNGEEPIRFITGHKDLWMGDHALMSAAVVLWLGGLAACYCTFDRMAPLSAAVTGLFLASVAIWLVTLAFELGAMPVSVMKLRVNADPFERTLAESLFAGSLIAGYFAMVPAWLGVFFGARTNWGRMSGIAGIAGIVYTLVVPNVWILAPTNAIPYIWTICYAWRCRASNRV